MRKKLFLVSGLLAATLFTACNNEEITMPQGDNEASQVETEGGQELVIALADGSLNMGRSSNAFARAVAAAGDAGAINAFGRPLYSSMASQYVQNIKVYFVDAQNKIARVVNVDKDYWKQSLAYNNGRKLTISLKGDKKLTATEQGTDYTVYAMAYSNTHGYQAFSPAENSTDATVGTNTGWSDFHATVTAENDPSEIFAGQASIKAIKSAEKECLELTDGKDALVTLYRQVAGISGYFKNIPANVNGDVPTHLRLVASGKNTKVLFGELDTNVGDAADKVSVNHVMNGAEASTSDKTAEYVGGKAKGHVVYEIELDKWFTEGFANADKDGDGFVTPNDVVTGGVNGEKAAWVNPNATVNNHVQGLVKGSVWGGKFVIPFAQTTSVPTLQLQLVQKAVDGKVSLLKYWNIKVDKTSTTASAVELPTGAIAAITGDESNEVYNIYRNHMYSIGKKNFDNGNQKPTEPVDPDKPNPEKPIDPDQPDPDPEGNNQPGDLSKGQDLTIHVNSNWEAVHNMEID